MKNLLCILSFITFILSGNTLLAQPCSCQTGTTITIGDNVGSGTFQSVLIGIEGSYNTFLGESAGRLNITGNDNTAIGNRSLGHNGGHTIIDFWKDRTGNTAVGSKIGNAATGDGDYNTMIGSHSFIQFKGGNRNIGLGYYAGQFAAGSDNIYLGSVSGKNLVGDNNIVLGRIGFTEETNLNDHLLIGNDNNSEFIVGDIVNGKLGINTNTPQNALDVCGKIRGDEFIIENDWCDYVFYKNYKGPTLTQEAQHIEEKGHLIGFQSEEEMNGEIRVADVTKRQQVKIEEMMLHLIEMNKRLTTLETENNQLKEEVKRLQRK